MKIRIVHIGKTSQTFEAAKEEYLFRLRHYARVESVNARKAKGIPRADTIEKEGERILSQIGAGDTVVALSEEGRQFDSVGFARWLSAVELESRTVVFVIGGAFGLGKNVKSRADIVISLSKMTLQHDAALAVLLEQLYRAFTIIRGENYHK